MNNPLPGMPGAEAARCRRFSPDATYTFRNKLQAFRIGMCGDNGGHGFYMVLAYPSIEGTATGKPVSAPHVER